MRVLIVGYGSIGRRHEEVLSSLEIINSIHIVSKQELPGKTTFHSLELVEDLSDYDYFVIATETFKHFEQLSYLEEKVENKLIFCEKPLFDSYQEISFVKNNIFVGYVLRYHPLLQKLFHDIKDQTVISANIISGSYLPEWRTVDYRKTYSSSKAQGGGVLLDLSHEIDFIQWLFGSFQQINSMQQKVSDLEIDSDDLVLAFGKTTEGTTVSFSLDYFSKIPTRKIHVNTMSKTIVVDLVENTYIAQGKDKSEEKYKLASLERNLMFGKMHKAILEDQMYSCTFDEGIETMRVIKEIQENNV